MVLRLCGKFFVLSRESESTVMNDGPRFYRGDLLQRIYETWPLLREGADVDQFHRYGQGVVEDLLAEIQHRDARIAELNKEILQLRNYMRLWVQQAEQIVDKGAGLNLGLWDPLVSRED